MATPVATATSRRRPETQTPREAVELMVLEALLGLRLEAQLEAQLGEPPRRQEVCPSGWPTFPWTRVATAHGGTGRV